MKAASTPPRPPSLAQTQSAQPGAGMGLSAYVSHALSTDAADDVSVVGTQTCWKSQMHSPVWGGILSGRMSPWNEMGSMASEPSHESLTARM